MKTIELRIGNHVQVWAIEGNAGRLLHTYRAV